MIYLINFISLCARSENIKVTYEAVACVTKPTNEKKEIISEMVEIKAFLSNLNGLIIASIIRYKSYFPYAYYSLVENRMKKNINEWLHIDWVFGTFPCTHTTFVAMAIVRQWCLIQLPLYTSPWVDLVQLENHIGSKSE